MSANFAAASSQYLENTGVGSSLAMPYTVGMWICPTATVGRAWSYADSASATNLFGFGWNNSGGNALPVMAFPSATTSIGSAFAIGSWFFFLMRLIASNNYRGSILAPNGTAAHAQRTVNLTFTPNRMAIGCADLSTRATFMSGFAAEFWITNIDVQVDNAQTNEDFLRTLAYDGPFSIPHVRASLVDYRSLKQSLSSDAERGAEIFNGRLGRQIWTNNNGVTIGQHVPVHHNATFKTKAAAAWGAITGGGSVRPNHGAALLAGA